MARRMSNRDRIDRLAAEKAAAQREKDEEKKTKAAKAAVPGAKKPRAPRKKKTATPIRMKAVWAVCRLGGDVVEMYPYAQRDVAESAAVRLNKEAAGDYIIRQERVPME
jgi:hypothetical protein